MKFNENLKYLRKEAKLTQEQLAEKLNVSRQAVTKWESGQSLPDIQNLKEMADMFEVTMDALVGDIGTKKESVMNKKLNDIGYFIFATVVVIGICIISVMEYINSVTNDENKVIISYIMLGIGAFVFFVYILKKFLQNSNEPIINMKDTIEGKNILNVNIYKTMIFADIFFSIIFGLPNAMSGLSDFFGNFIENIIMFLLITIFVAIKNYVDLEKKVKELNKEESFTNAQKYVII